MANTQKDTIYIDIDDEITTIIDKISNSDKRIVALVLPKRATVLQSVVNLKLLKKTSEDANKSIVLITSEPNLQPLAGLVGLHVAKTLQSKPAIPAPPIVGQSSSAVNEQSIDAPDASQTVDADDDTIHVDNDSKVQDSKKTKSKKEGKKPKIKIPNFDKFRLKVVIGVVALILLITGLFFATQVMPSAKIVIKTDSTNVPAELEITVNPKATEVDETTGVVPGVVKEVKKVDTETVPATGQIDNGTKASGTVSLKNCSASVEQVNIPAGTGVSSEGLNFITKSSVTLPATTKNGLNQCTTSSKDVDVTAQSGGEKYNLAEGKSFSVAGFSSVSGVSSTAMSGGTSVIVKVVSQKDIDDATQKIQDRSDAIRDELLGDMEQNGLLGLRETFGIKGQAEVTSVPKVNEQGSEVKVTQTVTYTMLGANKESIKKLIAKNVEGKIDTTKQVILDDGLAKAAVILKEKKPSGEAVINLKSDVLAGPQLDENAIKQQILGKKKSQTITAIKSRPGIQDVQVSYSPFWVSSTPKKVTKITVVFEQKSSDDK